MERKEVDIQILIEKGDFIVVSLADFDVMDYQNLAVMLRPIITVRKDAVYIPMFENEQRLCADNVWAALSSLKQRGLFANTNAMNYTELLSELGKDRKTVYIISKNSQVREKIIRENTARVRTVFCDLEADGRLYWSQGVFTQRGAAPSSLKGGQYTSRNSNPHIQKRDNPAKAVSAPKQRDYVIATTPTIQGIRKLTSTVRVSEGSILYNSVKNTYRLVKKEFRNNGAYTYSTNQPGIWAKIYDENYNSSFFEDKIRRMLKNPVNVEGIIWPKDILTDSDDVFRGFLINSFSGQPLQTSVLKRDGQMQYFPYWTKTDICTLTLTILQKIKELHKRGILLGCINPAAIRVVDQNTVFFCDTDDYQIEGYPTLSNNISFAAPENLDKRLYLASLDSENFSVAELVFMLMMTGKTPYLSGNSNIIDTIKRMRFPFFVNDYDERNPSLRVMPSMWRYMWSHLSFGMKKAFCSTFQRNMPFNAQGKRLSAFKWYDIVEQYRNEVMHSSSSEDNALYPATFKKKEGDTFYRCSKCGKEHPKFFFDPEYFHDYQVCNACMDMPSDKSYTCVDCGRTFIYKNRTALFHQRMRATNDDWKNQRHCPECKAKKAKCSGCGKMVPYYEINDGLCKDCRENTVFERRTCKECGRSFSITYAEKKYFDSKGFSYPRKCEICRKNKNSGGNSGSSKSGTKRGGFFGGIFGF